MIRLYSVAPYPMVFGSRLPNQVSANIQTTSKTAVRAT